jgi:prophage antirepressor-like protein
MDNKLEVFKNEEFGQVRAKTIGNEPYVCLADVCKILEIKNPRDYKKRLNQDGVVSSYAIDSIGRNQIMTFINESNLYKVIFHSRKQEAEKFTEWVTGEILPSIRKNGGYIANQEQLSEEELIAKALLVAEKKISEKEEQIKSLSERNEQNEAAIKVMTNKVNYLDTILLNDSTITITSIAKDYGMSGVRMNQLLEELGIQYKQSQQWFLYSKYQNKGYTHSKSTQILRGNGTVGFKNTTEWTQKGKAFIYKKLKDNGILPLIERS